MNFGTRTDARESRAIVERALERGAKAFDTANMYGDGASERLLGEALKGRRGRVFLATKAGIGKLGGPPEGLAPARQRAALAESLERLQTDWVDLFYWHTPDPRTPFAEALDGVQAILEGGQARAWGVSNHAAWQIVELNALCDARKLPRPAYSQVLYNLLIRQLDVEYFAFARKHAIHTTVFNPLAGGLLARAPAPGDEAPKDSRFGKNPIYRRRYWSEANFRALNRYRELAAGQGMDLVTFAYAWLAERPGVDSVLVGPATVAHLDAALDGCASQLSSELRQRVDEVHRELLGTDASYAR